MMLMATINIGEAKDLRERPLDCWTRFDEPTSRTMEPAAIPRINLVMSRYMGSSPFPNSPSAPSGSKLKGADFVFSQTMSHTMANSPMAVAIPGKPGSIHQVYGFPWWGGPRRVRMGLRPTNSDEKPMPRLEGGQYCPQPAFSRLRRAQLACAAKSGS